MTNHVTMDVFYVVINNITVPLRKATLEEFDGYKVRQEFRDHELVQTS